MRTDLSTPQLIPHGDDWTLIVDRPLPQTPEQVWTALTEPDQIRAWLPFSPDRPLAAVGPVLLTDLGISNPATREAFVHEAVAPRLLVVSWGGDTLRWELTLNATGTRLILSHTFTDRSQAPSFAAGWHLCLDALADLLTGRQGPPVVGDAAMEHGYAKLLDGYSRLLGIYAPAQGQG